MGKKKIIMNSLVIILFKRNILKFRRILKIKDVHYVELTLSRSHRNPIIPRSNAITPS